MLRGAWQWFTLAAATPFMIRAAFWLLAFWLLTLIWRNVRPRST